MSEKPKIPVVDIREEMAKGTVFRVAEDQFIGAPNVIGSPSAGPTLDTRPDWEKWPRKVERYQGEIPMHDGRVQVRFLLSRKCDVLNDEGKKCGTTLVAQRAVNFRFVKDTQGYGGQLEYLINDVRYYIQCPVHGPHPAGPTHWAPT